MDTKRELSVEEQKVDPLPESASSSKLLYFDICDFRIEAVVANEIR